ncbi:hypothetical protein GQ600_27119 [Phytophthora cactorum]|nr:hypothetical protein GQ600_27119 [Phytophthora cactorum]
MLVKKRANPPKFAIANGLYMGQLPNDFKDSSFIENEMFNLSPPMHFISLTEVATMRTRVVVDRYDRQSDAFVGEFVENEDDSERSNSNNRNEAENLGELQRSSDSRSDVVVRRQRAEISKRCRTWRSRLWISGMSSVGEDGSSLHARVGDGCDELDRATWRRNAPAPAHQNVKAEDEVCEQAADGLINNFTHVDATLGFQLALSNNKERFIVHRSTNILSDFDPAFWARAFGDLFPCGRGRDQSK